LKVPSFVVVAFLAVAVPLLAAAALTNDDKIAIGEQVQLIVQAVNTGNPAPVRSIISPNARPTLLAELEDALAGNPIEFQESISSYDEIALDMVRVKGRFTAKTPNWNMSGLGNSFTFEKVDGKWMLNDTDFYTKLNKKTILMILAVIFPIMFLVIILLSAFWIWMLVDVAKSPLSNKTKWVLIIVFFQSIGAVIYFFTARKEYRAQMKEK